jgi:hypothetical protein
MMDLPEWLLSDNVVTGVLSGLAYGFLQGDYQGAGLRAGLTYIVVGFASSYFHISQLYRGNVVNGAKA